MQEFLSKYFEWNKSLRLYFLDESDLLVKLLTIDDSALSIIGNRYGIQKPKDITFSDYFLKCVCLSNGDRNKMIHFMKEEMRKPIKCPDDPSLFQLAYSLSKISDNGDLFKLPCFALMALFVLLCVNSKDPKQIVIKSLSQNTGNDYNSEEKGFEHIPDILSAIREYDHMFDDGIRGVRKNVGRLQHQRVLNQSESALFRKFLYRYHVSLDETSFTSYEDLMNYSLLNKLTGEYSILRERMVKQNKFSNEHYFIRQIQCFDRDQYEETLKISEDNNRPQVDGFLFLLIDCQERGFSVFTDVKVDRDIKTRFGTIPRSLGESETGFYPTNICIHSLKEYVDLEESNGLFDDTYKLSIGESKRYMCFQLSRGKLFQVYQQMPGQEYYFVCQPKFVESAILNNQEFESVEAPAFFIRDEGWAFFHVKSWKFYNTRSKVNYESPIRSGPGIPVPGKNDTFFADGLPVIVSTLPIEVSLEKNILGRGNRTIGRNVTFRDGVNYIDIRNIHDLFPDGASELPVKVVARQEGTKSFSDNYLVMRPQVDILEVAVFQELFSTDGWGRVCCNRPEEPRMNDNQLYNQDVFLSNSCVCESRQRLQAPDERSIRFINLLKAYYNKKGFLSRKDINSIVHYLSGYYKLEPTCDQMKTGYVVFLKALVDLGFINKSYDKNGNTIFQVASPRLFPIKKNEYLTEYLLYGSYLNGQMKCLRNITSNYYYLNPYSEEDVRECPLLFFVPQYMIISFLNEDSLERVRDIGISVEETSLSDRLLSLIKSPISFESDFMIEENRRLNSSYDINAVYPRVVGDGRTSQLEVGNFVYDRYTPDNNEYRIAHIPYDLMQQYCQFIHNKPVLYHSKKTIGFISGMALPGLLKKCLAYFNLGLPTVQYAFSLSGLFGDRLICRLVEYDIPIEAHCIIASKLSGSVEPNRMIHYESFKSNRYTMYYEQTAFEPFIIFVFFNFSNNEPCAYARKVKGEYVVFKKDGDSYSKLNYPTAREALAAVITEPEDLSSHLDPNCRDDRRFFTIHNRQIIKIIK